MTDFYSLDEFFINDSEETLPTLDRNWTFYAATDEEYGTDLEELKKKKAKQKEEQDERMGITKKRGKKGKITEEDEEERKLDDVKTEDADAVKKQQQRTMGQNQVIMRHQKFTFPRVRE